MPLICWLEDCVVQCGSEARLLLCSSWLCARKRTLPLFDGAKQLVRIQRLFDAIGTIAGAEATRNTVSCVKLKVICKMQATLHCCLQTSSAQKFRYQMNAADVHSHVLGCCCFCSSSRTVALHLYFWVNCVFACVRCILFRNAFRHQQTHNMRSCISFAAKFIHPPCPRENVLNRITFVPFLAGNASLRWKRVIVRTALVFY